jgi:hypothetical protein
MPIVRRLPFKALATPAFYFPLRMLCPDVNLESVRPGEHGQARLACVFLITVASFFMSCQCMLVCEVGFAFVTRVVLDVVVCTDVTCEVRLYLKVLIAFLARESMLAIMFHLSVPAEPVPGVE